MTNLFIAIALAAAGLAATAALAETPLDEARTELDRLLAAERTSGRQITQDRLHLFASPLGEVSFGVGDASRVNPDPAPGVELDRRLDEYREGAGR
ncbi:MAG: hypothetical protein RQ752_01325 [Thermohalobaculum sp.]|nr:hypothetical protein [Thermohalobaculum sp.]